MNFLRKEVHGDEMVQLARTGYGPQHNFRKNNASVECVIQSELATASALVSLDSELLKKRVRGLIDSGSQSSYIRERLVNQSAVQPLRTETVCHALLEGNQTDPKLHRGPMLWEKLLKGNVVTLHSGLTAVESKLVWTVFGKQKFCGKDKFTTTLSMHVGNIPSQNIWELEVLGITDPTKTVK
ncbi:uncharacterized protein TNCV_2874311 [Trichonephila clavipes]|nr:uncharacterized protein TNCV_2874311 [Trichonephila clavipes]